MWSRACSCFGGLVPEGNSPVGDDRGPDRKGKAKVEQTDEEDLKIEQKAEVEEKNEEKLAFGERETFHSLAAEYRRSERVLREKIQLLPRLYASFRRIRNDDASLYRSFLFAYVEHIWVTRDNTEVDRIGQSLTVCQWTNDIRGDICADFEELREMFLQLLYEHIREESRPRSHKEFLSRSLRQWDSSSMISLLGYAASNEMARQAAEILFDPDTDYDDVHSILGDGETIPYHRQLAALSDALGVTVRVVFLDTRLDRLGRPSPFHRDFSPTTHWKIPRWSRKTFPPDSISLDEVRYTLHAARRVATSSSSGHRLPFITLLYRPGGAAEADHYDILYPKLNVIPLAR